MPIIGSEGAASSKGFGFTIGGAEPVYIEQIFSTYLYRGDGSSQTITNGIDLAGKGGLVWEKTRDLEFQHILASTANGSGKYLSSNTTSALTTSTDLGAQAFSSTGFSSSKFNSPYTVASWTFRKQPKFFDVVTYTGNGASSRNIAHNLGSVPGCFIVKETNYSGTNWRVYHRSLGNTNEVYLNTTAASTATTSWASTTPTSAVFTVGVSGGAGPNDSGSNYVAYLFAHDAGGFGLTGTDNVVSCGSYTGNGSATGPTVSLGYEPQWVMVKATSATGNWAIEDNRRALSQNFGYTLNPNSSATESAINPSIIANSTGFNLGTTNSDFNASGVTYIYVAIRRGPMKTPTKGIQVFNTPDAIFAYRNWNTGYNFTLGRYVYSEELGINLDFALAKDGRASVSNWALVDSARGLPPPYPGAGTLKLPQLSTNDSSVEVTPSTNPYWDAYDTGLAAYQGTGANYPYICYGMARAPGFLDVVCYTGNNAGSSGSGNDGQTLTHNLGVQPELIITKCRSSSGFAAWMTGCKYGVSTQDLQLNSTAASGSFGVNAFPVTWNTNTATTFVVRQAGLGDAINQTGQTYVAYLFASAPGVSKVGSFTGSGATQVINCGFTGGARFVMIKATSTTGNWLVWDSARGIVAGNDPYLALNSTAAEVTNTDWVDTAATGFELSNAGGNLANSSGVTYIFLAIA